MKIARKITDILAGLLLLAGLFLSPIFSSTAHAQAWPVNRDWTDKTEDEFGLWFKKNGTADFFSNTDPQTSHLRGQIGVDCARSAFVFRAVFAAESGLPFSYVYITESKGDDGKIHVQSHLVDSRNFRSPLQDAFARKVAFIAQMKDNVSTRAISFNTFPIVVNRENVTGGTVFGFKVASDEDEAARHIFSVREVNNAGVIHFIWATVPASTRLLTERILFPSFMPTVVSRDDKWGFRRFYQPQDFQQMIDMHRGSAAEQAAAQQVLIESITKRGYSDTDQNEISTKVLADYTKDYQDYVQKNGIQDSYKTQIAKHSVEVSLANFMRLMNIRDNLQKSTCAMWDAAVSERTGLEMKTADEEKEKVEALKIPIAQKRKKEDDIDDKIITAPLPTITEASLADSTPTPWSLSVIHKYQQALFNRLAKRDTHGVGMDETLPDKLRRDFWNLCLFARERQAAVEEGYNYFFVLKSIVSAPNQFNRCPSDKEIEDYTTPDRDDQMYRWLDGEHSWFKENKARIKQKNISVYLKYDVIFEDGADITDEDVPGWHRDYTIQKTKELIDQEPINIGGSELCQVKVDMHNGAAPMMMHIWEAVRQFKNKTQISSAPWVSIERRWGLEQADDATILLEHKFKCEVAAPVEQGQ